MPLDHYVPQVHLRQFVSPALNGQMYALRKTDLMAFQPRPQDVCRIESGNSNAYVAHDRAIEDFLKTVEPSYTKSIEVLATGRFTPETIYVISGFVAYVMLCSPAYMRVGAAIPRNMLEGSARLLDSMGALPQLPDALGGASLSESLETGTVKFDVDPKYAQALGITNVINAMRMYGNFAWDIIRNEDADSPFFTSDYPVGIEVSKDSRVLNRIVPLSPSLAIRICPDIRLDRKACDDSFSHFRSRIVRADHRLVAYLNQIIVRSAETTVFFREEQPWIPRFVAKHRNFRIEPRIHTFTDGTRETAMFQQRIAVPSLDA